MSLLPFFGSGTEVAVEVEEVEDSKDIPLQGSQTTGEGPVSRWPFGGDPLARLLLASPLLNGALFIYVAATYRQLPATIPLRFNGQGEVLSSGPATALFLVPLSGLLAWVLNGLFGWTFYRRPGEQPVAYLLWAVSLLVQVAAWIATLRLLT